MASGLVEVSHVLIEARFAERLTILRALWLACLGITIKRILEVYLAHSSMAFDRRAHGVIGDCIERLFEQR